ncbi:hypothetical protein E4T42_06905 [Aureobasidium subglaciale]|nr:hypothetical protein E4T42_06905 [Aureobasidium subglaciale]
MQATKLMSRAFALTVQQPSLTLFRAFASYTTFKQCVSDLTKHDHAELRIYKNNIINSANGDEKRRWQNQFVWELARHSIAEEPVVTDFDRCRMFVPTRSHPMAPNTGGPFETVASLMSAPLDRLGDMFRRYPKTH